MGLYGYYTFPATPLLRWRKIQKKEPYRLIFVASLLLRCASLFGVFVRRTPRYGRLLTGKSQKCDTPHEEAAGEGRS